jgi:tripartite-type tricarboxylate transporter receptor subunit TctC
MNFAFPRTPGAWLAAIAALLLACAAPAAVAGDGVVRLVVPAPAGGNLDMTARALAQRLAALTGEPHVVENRPGANTAIGSEYVARAPADGRVLLYTGSSLVLNAWLQKLAFSPLEDLRPVVQVAVGHYVLVVSAASGIASPRELAARAAERQQGLNCAAPPGPMGIACEQLRARLGGKVTTVPYPGIAPAVTALLGRHVDLMFVNLEAVEPLMQAGRLRAIAASSTVAAPGVPLIARAWPGFLLEGFSGLFVPARTPPSRIRQLNRQVNQVLRDPQFSGFMAETRQQAGGGSPDQFAVQVADAHRRYGEVIRSLGLQIR